jgi:hypothetical protein
MELWWLDSSEPERTENILQMPTHWRLSGRHTASLIIYDNCIYYDNKFTSVKKEAAQYAIIKKNCIARSFINGSWLKQGKGDEYEGFLR